jgi:hypothetical protein
VAKGVLEKLVSQPRCYPVILFHTLGGKPESWLPRQLLGFSQELHKRFDMRFGVQLHKLVEMK